MRHTFALFSAAITACVLLTSCLGGGEGPPQLALKGFVVADDPIAGASVTVDGPDGTRLAGPTSSNQHGVFVLLLDQLPEGATISATGGTYNGASFSGSMRATLPPAFNARLNVAYLTPAMTLAHAYRNRHAGTTTTQAQEKVKQFLQIPLHIRLPRIKRHDPAIFSASAFMSQGMAYQDNAGGGFDRYVQSVAAEMQLGSSRSYGSSGPLAAGLPMRPLAAEAAESSLAVAGLKWLLTNLAGGAVGAAGAKTFSTVLSLTGLAPTDLSQVQAQLDDISVQINTLGNQVATLGTTLDCDITKYGYNNQVGGDVQEKFDTVASVASMTDALSRMQSTDAGYANTKADISTIVANNQSIHTDVFYFIAGNTALGTMGAVRGLGGTLKACGNFFNADKSAAVAAQYLYLTSLQRAACAAVVAYRNDRLETSLATEAADLCKNSYTPSLLGIVTPNSIPPGSTDVIDVRYRYMWRNLGLQQGAGVFPNGVFTDIAIIDARTMLANSPPEAGQYWAVPALGDMGSFITPCYTTPGGLKDCLSKSGWASRTLDPVTNTYKYTSFYGLGDPFFWNNDGGRVASNGNPDAQYLDNILAYNGSNSEGDCYTCFANVMLIRTLDSSEAYWID